MHEAAGDAEPAALRAELHRASADRTHSTLALTSGLCLFHFSFCPKAEHFTKLSLLPCHIILEKQNSFGSRIIRASQPASSLGRKNLPWLFSTVQLWYRPQFFLILWWSLLSSSSLLLHISVLNSQIQKDNQGSAGVCGNQR